MRLVIRRNEVPGLVIQRALAEPDNQPVVRTLCLTSGGGDSTVLAHRCRDYYDELAHIDTGTALPGVREFVEEFASIIKKPLRIVEAGEAYRYLVLGHDDWWRLYVADRNDDEAPEEYLKRMSKLPTREQRMEKLVHRGPLGFPGPAGHKFAYQRLKERQLERLLREVKEDFGDGRRANRVALLSGVRLDESARRKMTGAAQGEWERRGNQLWINPLLSWTNERMRWYRRHYKLPQSDVTAIIHRSGECNCLAFASKDEREEIIQWYPDWYAKNIAPIEQEARKRGLKHWQWGWGAGELTVDRPEAAGPMCSSCELRLAHA